MANRSTLALTVMLAAAATAAPRAAHAQLAEPLGPTPDGSLRVDLHCADYWATPAKGLRVTVDGAPAADVGINGMPVLRDGKHGPYTVWAPTDVGFDVAPGTHAIAVAAPDCTGVTQDVSVAADHPTYISGRLAIDDPELLGTTAAPNGIGITIGGTAQPIAARSGTSTLGPESTAYESGAGSAAGLWMSTSYEHRHLVIALDTGFTHGTVDGSLRPLDAQTSTSPAMPYTDSVMSSTSAFRIGARVPLRYAALAAGTGIGLSITDHQSTTLSEPGAAFAIPPDGVDASVFVPVWAAVTVKPFCDVGVQAIASYDISPGGSLDHGASISTGVIWQPSRACSEPAGVRVH